MTKKNRKRGRFIRRFTRVIALFTLILFGFTVYFAATTDPPILKGDVSYGVPYNQEQTLDLYFPTQQVFDKAPVVVYIHGGAWFAGAKETVNNNRFNKAFNELRDAGYAIVSPSYTLADGKKAPFPNCMYDINEALVWISENADSLNLDEERLGIMGESAGAHIAMMVIFSGSKAIDREYDIPEVDYFIDVYGPSNLHGIYHLQMLDSINHMLERLPDFVREQIEIDIPSYLLGFDPKLDSVRAQNFLDKYTPLYYLEDAPPTLIIHGSADFVVPIDQSLQLKPKLDSLGIPNEMHILPDVHHAFGGISEEQHDSVQTWITEFVLRQYPEFN